MFDDDAEAGLSPGFGFDATLDAGFERLRLGPDPPIGEREEGGVGADGAGAFDAEAGARGARGRRREPPTPNQGGDAAGAGGG